MWAMQDDWVNRGFRLSSAILVACMILVSDRITLGPVTIIRVPC